MNAIRPFHLAVDDAVLDDLRRRLDGVRWPDRETAEGWTQGVPLDEARLLVDHWRHRYDWRRCEAMLNGFGQYRTVIDGLDIHFLHVRSPVPDAVPMILTHGWPGSVIEFHKVIGPLSDPQAHGGDASDAFHLVIPSLPGYGFSEQPREPGWSVPRIARAWAELMRRLGYDRYVAQGGDWGAAVTTALGADRPEGLAAIHLNLPLVLPQDPGQHLDPDEAAMMAALAAYDREESGYSRQQASRPQTIGYGLADSPVGQAMWIYEKLRAWSDCDGNPRTILTLDEMLDNIMLYWIPNTAASSARLYWESFEGGFFARKLTLPTGCSVFPAELYRAPRSWADRTMDDIIHWNELPKGGHFAAFEQPATFVDEVRACFRTIR